MDETRARIDELQNEAFDLPHCATQVSLLEEAVQLADSINDGELAYELRDSLIDAAMFSERGDLVLVHFAWCLAKFDRDPSQFDADSLLWKYKWVVNSAVAFPEITRKQLDDLFVDMERRFREGGHSMHAVHQKRRFVLMKMGDADGARAAHEEFARHRRDRLSDCAACVPSEDISYFVFLGDWKKAVASGESVIRRHLRCAEEPRNLYSKLLLPMAHLGRIEEARAWHATAYKQMVREEHAGDESGRHLTFAVLAGDLPRARKMLERHLPEALAAVTPDERYEFYLAAALLMDRLIALGKSGFKLRLPDSLPAPDAKGRSDLAALKAWFLNEAGRIAARYDARNGNDLYRRRIDELPRLLELCAAPDADAPPA